MYTCPKFRSMSHDDMIALLKSNDHCLNCLRPGHYVKDCKSLHHCKVCQKPHHSLLHVDNKAKIPKTNDSGRPDAPVASSHRASIRSSLLLMTCQVLVQSPQGVLQVRALLDSGSSVSFMSERVAQTLCLHHSSQNAKVCGITGFSLGNCTQSLTSLQIAPVHSPSRMFDVSAIVVPHVTCDLPVHPVPFNHKWEHIKGLRLADLEFGKPWRVDILLGVETFVDIVCKGRQKGRQGTPIAIETTFGWVLAGNTGSEDSRVIASHHVSLLMGDDLLRQFWEIEEKSMANSTLTPEEHIPS